MTNISDFDLAAYTMPRQVKDSILHQLFRSKYNVSIERFMQLSKGLRFTTFFQFCLTKYKQFEENFEKYHTLDNSQTKMAQQITDYMKKISRNPYAFIMGNQQGFKIQEFQKQDIQLIQVSFGKKGSEGIRFKYLLYKILKYNLKECIKFYNNEKIQEFEKQMRTLARQEKYPNPNKVKQLILHGLNVHTLSTIIDELQSISSKMDFSLNNLYQIYKSRFKVGFQIIKNSALNKKLKGKPDFSEIIKKQQTERQNLKKQQQERQKKRIQDQKLAELKKLNQEKKKRQDQRNQQNYQRAKYEDDLNKLYITQAFGKLHQNYLQHDGSQAAKYFKQLLQEKNRKQQKSSKKK